MNERNEAPVDRVREVLNFQGRRQDWLSAQTGISYERLMRLLNGQATYYWDWEAEQVSLALQVPVDILFPDPVRLRTSGRQLGTTRRLVDESLVDESLAKAVAS